MYYSYYTIAIYVMETASIQIRPLVLLGVLCVMNIVIGMLSKTNLEGIFVDPMQVIM